MNLVGWNQLPSVLNTISPGSRLSLVGGADVRQFGAIDAPRLGASPVTLSFIDVILAPDPQ